MPMLLESCHNPCFPALSFFQGPLVDAAHSSSSVSAVGLSHLPTAGVLAGHKRPVRCSKIFGFGWLRLPELIYIIQKISIIWLKRFYNVSQFKSHSNPSDNLSTGVCGRASDKDRKFAHPNGGSINQVFASWWFWDVVGYLLVHAGVIFQQYGLKPMGSLHVFLQLWTSAVYDCSCMLL